MRQLLRIVLLLVFMVATGCIYARSKGGTNTGSGADKQGGPWTQGEPPSQALTPDR